MVHGSPHLLQCEAAHLGGGKGKILCEKALEMHLCHGRAGMIRNIEPDHGQLQASFTMTNPASSPLLQHCCCHGHHPDLWQRCLSRRALVTASDFPLGTQVSITPHNLHPPFCQHSYRRYTVDFSYCCFLHRHAPASPVLLTPAMSPASQVSMWKNHCEGKSSFC